MMNDADQTASSVSNTSASSANTLLPQNVVVRKITITKSKTNGFGFNIIGGTDGPPHIPGHDGIFISLVRNADLRGIISEGDRIISVNGTSMEAITHDEAVNLLKGLQGECVFTIEANAERAANMSIDTTPEGSIATETGPSQTSSTLNASLHPMPVVNDTNKNPSQFTEIAIVVVGAAALSLIAYLSYNRIQKGTWWR